MIMKKVTAVLGSLLFTGMTLAGASAYDLGSYPSPFVKNGTFNGNIVVGSSAQSEDILGAVDIGTSLQYANKQKVSYTQDVDTTIDGGFKVERSGNKFNYGDSVSSILDGTSLTEDDMPQILSDGKFTESQGENKNSVTYSQKIKFLDEGTANWVYTQDEDGAEEADSYLHISKRKPMYEYTMDFDNSVKYDVDDASDDLKTTTLSIQGKTYTISDVSLKSDDSIDKIDLISGEAVLWLTQNQPITKVINGVEHDIEVLDVTEKEDACQVKVDGTTSIINTDTTKTINGVQLGITDVRAIHSQLQDSDVCQVSVGASEVELKDGSEIKIDDLDMDGSNVEIESNNGELNSITITYTPKNLDDDLYLKAKEAWTDPVFSSWKIVNGESSSDYERYTLKTSGDNDAVLTFDNNDNKKIEIPFYYDDNTNTTVLGDGIDPEDRIYSSGSYNDLTNNVCDTDDVEKCEDMKILATTTGGEAHIFEITNIDTDNNKLDVRDTTYGRNYNDVSYSENVSSSLDLGSFGTGVSLKIKESYTNGVHQLNTTVVDGISPGVNGVHQLNTTVINGIKPSVEVVSSIQSDIETNSGAKITDISNTDKSKIVIKLDETGIDADGTKDILDLTIRPNSDNEIIVDADWETSSSSVDSKEDSDVSILMSNIGTKVYLNDDKTSVEIEMPTDEIYNNVYIAPLTSKLVETNDTGAYLINKIPVGTSKLDTEISDVTSTNNILVGGPCINSITQKVMGFTSPMCGDGSGIQPNTAIIRSYTQTNGNVAIVVAGYEAKNTRLASRVLANYDLNDISGNGIIITGTDLSNMVISKSS